MCVCVCVCVCVFGVCGVRGGWGVRVCVYVCVYVYVGGCGCGVGASGGRGGGLRVTTIQYPGNTNHRELSPKKKKRKEKERFLRCDHDFLSDLSLLLSLLQSQSLGPPCLRGQGYCNQEHSATGSLAFPETSIAQSGNRQTAFTSLYLPEDNGLFNLYFHQQSRMLPVLFVVDFKLLRSRLHAWTKALRRTGKHGLQCNNV